MAKALLFNITGDKRKKLGFLCMQYGIVIQEGTAADQTRPLSRILGRGDQGAPNTLDAPFSDEMLVLDGLSQEQFHGLLNGLQMLRSTVTCKAITTEHNLAWTPARLYRELAAEHAALNGR